MRVIDQPGIGSKLGEADDKSERRNRASNTSRLASTKPTSKQLSTMLSATPVRQFDHGANVNNETITMLMIIVASTTRRRPRSSKMSYAFMAITVSIWRWQQQESLCARSLCRLTPAALHQLDNGGFQQRQY